jgi:tRNA (guanine-N7-)-methyltransferase
VGRLRTNPNAATEIKLSPFLIQNTKTIGFKNNVILEIGCGKGDFIIENALKFPENNYIGVEKYATVLLKAIKKISILTTPPTNIKFILGDFQEIYPDLKPHSITKIFLNFSDP